MMSTSWDGAATDRRVMSVTHDDAGGDQPIRITAAASIECVGCSAQPSTMSINGSSDGR